MAGLRTIPVVLVLLSSHLLVAERASAQADPDALYADRQNLASAQRAAAIWEERLTAKPDDFDAFWKLARVCYWIGKHVAPAEQRKQFERGVTAGRQAAALEPKRPEGYFWMAANM